ncbi:glycyl-radical enzyme activating protein [Clostridium butyricum]|uniref:glycyl-radical enzyme activating protein n=1 Tax=Clostridium butyricum TaxID=1492 RepID=UPI00374F45B0
MLKSQINYEKKGNVFNMQRFSINDGPGLRTIVFLKGCPLSCIWCSNPESQNKNSQVMFNIKNCTACGNCKEICSVHAIDIDSEYRIDRRKCINCGKCIEECYSEALVMCGKEMTVYDVIKELKKEDVIFRCSKGGVTLSGGEPLMQPEFSIELLKACKSLGWHTTMETTGYADESVIEDVMPWVDLVLMDFKTIDESMHFKYTGVSNKIILENAKKIVNLVPEVIARVPVIPGFNADESSINAIAKYVKELERIKEVHLLPYHRFGVNKYACIGRKYAIDNKVKSPDNDTMVKFKNIVESYGLKCNIGDN